MGLWLPCGQDNPEASAAVGTYLKRYITAVRIRDSLTGEKAKSLTGILRRYSLVEELGANALRNSSAVVLYGYNNRAVVRPFRA